MVDSALSNINVNGDLIRLERYTTNSVISSILTSAVSPSPFHSDSLPIFTNTTTMFTSHTSLVRQAICTGRAMSTAQPNVGPSWAQSGILAGGSAFLAWLGWDIYQQVIHTNESAVRAVDMAAQVPELAALLGAPPSLTTWRVCDKPAAAFSLAVLPRATHTPHQWPHPHSECTRPSSSPCTSTSHTLRDYPALAKNMTATAGCQSHLPAREAQLRLSSQQSKTRPLGLGSH